MTNRAIEVEVSERLLEQAKLLGLDLSDILTRALQERLNAHKEQSQPTAPVYVEKPLTDAQREQAANKLRLSKRVFADVPFGMD